MGAWGTGLFSDDLAADLRANFRDLIGEGLAASEAVDQLANEYVSSLDDEDEGCVFWLALAATEWQLGRLEKRTLKNAIQVIDSGRDMQRWVDAKDRKKRARVLSQLKEKLLSPPPPMKRVPRRVKSACDWAIGEIVAFRLASGNWALIRVVGHHSDRGGRSAICELLDWVGDQIPAPEVIAALPIRAETTPRAISQFLFQEPQMPRDQARVLRTGLSSNPAQVPGRYTAFVWPFVDQLFKEVFGIE